METHSMYHLVFYIKILKFFWFLLNLSHPLYNYTLHSKPCWRQHPIPTFSGTGLIKKKYLSFTVGFGFFALPIFLYVYISQSWNVRSCWVNETHKAKLYPMGAKKENNRTFISTLQWCHSWRVDLYSWLHSTAPLNPTRDPLLSKRWASGRGASLIPNTAYELLSVPQGLSARPVPLCNTYVPQKPEL